MKLLLGVFTFELVIFLQNVIVHHEPTLDCWNPPPCSLVGPVRGFHPHLGAVHRIRYPFSYAGTVTPSPPSPSSSLLTIPFNTAKLNGAYTYALAISGLTQTYDYNGMSTGRRYSIIVTNGGYNTTTGMLI
jgi:hypothetical protein